MGGHSLAGGALRFREVEVLCRNRPAEVVPFDAVAALWPEAQPALERIACPRADLTGIKLSTPRVMGVVNVTPDSFSDGGQLAGPEAAIAHAMTMVADGADILDIGGESTRPGATPVGEDEETERVIPVIEGLISRGCAVPISIDTRNAAVAKAAIDAGARIINDVSALTHDPDSLNSALAADGVCLMHALGDPRTMQNNPTYENVLLDIYDYLADRLAAATTHGIDPAEVLVDPGIGFGKTIAHNLDLVRNLSLFHGLGCGMLLGVSRKGFIGKLGVEPQADLRLGGSLAVGLAGLDQGAQILRVHDVKQTAQAVRLWRALNRG
ncbi:MAG: dihydropteroate synthase [Pseudomonadota bacterium]